MPGKRLLRFCCMFLIPGFCATSHAADKLLYKERSAYRDIFVSEQDDVRCMRFSHRTAARQSCVNLKNPDSLVFLYTKMTLGALYLVPEPRRILVIGLGGGTLPNVFSSLYPDSEIHAVEIDPAVIKVAEKYFGFRPNEGNMRTFEEDGRMFVKRALRKGEGYDLIILDAYDHEYIPEHMLTKEFLEEVRRLLLPDGVLVANTWSLSKLYDHESATYEAVYGDFFNLKDLSRVILAKREALPSMDEVKKNAAALDQKLARFGVDKDWLLSLFTTQKDWRRDARVLTDRYSPSNLLNVK